MYDYDLKVFLAQGSQLPENKKIHVSNRFLDEKGNPVFWEIRAITQWESQSIQKENNPERYWGKLCAVCVVFPHLQDEKLLESYGVSSGEEALKKMLSIGEYMRLVKEVRELNGFQRNAYEWRQEAKN